MKQHSLRPPQRGYALGLAVLAACGVLAATVVVSAFGATVTTTGTTTSTSSTTGTTTTTGTLPPPYDKPPWLKCPSSVTVPNRVHRSKRRSFYLYNGCEGLAKQASIQLTSLPKGSRFIVKGSRENTCTVNRNGPLSCWQKHPAQLVNGKLTWPEHDLTPRRNGRQVVWEVIVHIRLSRTAPLGRHCYSFLKQASNGSLTLSPDDQVVSGCYSIYK